MALTRRTQIEQIIIGTLAASFSEYWNEVRCCLTPEHFTDTTCRETFALMERMADEGSTAGLDTLLMQMDKDTADEVARMAAFCDFEYLRWRHNSWNYWHGGTLTDVTFDQYVTKLLKYGRQEQA